MPATCGLLLCDDLIFTSKVLGTAKALGLEFHAARDSRLLLDLAKTSFGPGRLSYDEFIGLRLFDEAWLAGADISQFVGLDAERRIWMKAPLSR